MVQLVDIGLVTEGAKKICPDCGKSILGNHYWYKGMRRCKGTSERARSRPATTDAEGNEEPPRKTEADKRREDPHTISAMDTLKIKAKTKAEAREEINKHFPKAGQEAKGYAYRIWLRHNKNAPEK